MPSAIFTFPTLKGRGIVAVSWRGVLVSEKIISWVTWPKKSCWRMVSRSLQIALERGPENWQVWNLRDASVILRKKLSNLHVPNSRFTCGRPAKAPWQATVHVSQ